MGILDELMLGYVLKKLTGVFEDFVRASQHAAPGNPTGTPALGSQQRKTTVKVPAWLGRLKANKPYDVSRVLFEQMRMTKQFDQYVRFEAQMGLLEALVEEGLAMDVASYSAACRQAPSFQSAAVSEDDATSGFFKRTP
ncbi:MAG: hypothetical protein P4N59_02920 [Negativicutes bacterium]|nr:hypothetical protein [Negativicutes bacterium]